MYGISVTFITIEYGNISTRSVFNGFLEIIPYSTNSKWKLATFICIEYGNNLKTPIFNKILKKIPYSVYRGWERVVSQELRHYW